MRFLGRFRPPKSTSSGSPPASPATATPSSMTAARPGAGGSRPRGHSRHPTDAVAQSGARLPRTTPSSCRSCTMRRPASSGRFLLVVKRLHSERGEQERHGVWAGFGIDETRGPADSDEQPGSIGSLPWRGAVVAGRDMCGLRRRRRDGQQSDRLPAGPAITWAGSWTSQAEVAARPSRLPVQPDNFMETLLYLLFQVSARRRMIPLDDKETAHVVVRRHGLRGCDRAGYYKRADFATRLG